MTQSNNRRGRPKGDGKDDTDTLRQMAKLIDVEPGLKPMTAMRRVLERPDDSTVRRLSRKWRQRGSEYLEEVRQRAPQQSPRRSVDIATLRSSMPVGGIMAKTVQDYLESPAVQAARDMMNYPGLRTAWEVMNDPAMRAARAMMDDPVTRLARGDHATLPAVRDVQRQVDLISAQTNVLDRLRKAGLI